MSTDFLLREQFLTSPAQVVADFVTNSTLAEDQAESLNEIIYSIASSSSLMTWLRVYAIQNKATQPSLDQVLEDFGNAVVNQKSHSVVRSLIVSIARGTPLISFEAMGSAVRAILHIFGPIADQPGGVVGDASLLRTYTWTDGTWSTDVTSVTWTTDTTGTIFTAGGTVLREMPIDTPGAYATGPDSAEADSAEANATEADAIEADATGAFSTEADSIEADSTGAYPTGATDQPDLTLEFSEFNWALVTLNALAQYAQQLAQAGALGRAHQG